MTWIAKTTFIAAGALACSAPALANVRVTQGFTVAGRPLLVTNQGEVYSVAGPAEPARRLGRLSRRASSLVPSDQQAWAVETGRHDAGDVRFYRIDAMQGEMEEIVSASSAIDGPFPIEGLAGADSRFVYLLPDGRFDLQSRAIRPGHLDEAPDLQVIRVLLRGDEAWYLARDRRPDSTGTVRLWLLHDSIWNDQGLRVLAGVDEGPVDLVSDDRNLFLVFEAGRVLRFDNASLRLLEDLSPMLRPGPIEFFAADRLQYWVGTREAAEEGETRRALWRIERDTLDGAPIHAESLPEGYAPLGATDKTLWFASIDRTDANPLVSVDKGNLGARTYGVRGVHERRWRAFGRGARDAGETTLLVVGAVPVITIAIVTFPIWIWFVDAC